MIGGIKEKADGYFLLYFFKGGMNFSPIGECGLGHHCVISVTIKLGIYLFFTKYYIQEGWKLLKWLYKVESCGSSLSYCGYTEL